MHETFLWLTGLFTIRVVIGTLVAAVIGVHVAFLYATGRREVPCRYLPFMRVCLFRRGLPFALVTSCLLVVLLAVLPASCLAWYRTHTLHQYLHQPLRLRVYDRSDEPLGDGGYRLAYKLTHSTTNPTELSEFITAIRFGPTYPNLGCLCTSGRRFEVSYNICGYEGEEPIAVFTVPHGKQLRIEYDWYGDWYLSGESQRDLVAWQEKYID